MSQTILNQYWIDIIIQILLKGVNSPYNVYYVVFLNLLFIKIKYYYHYHYYYLLMKHSPKLRRIRFMLPSGKAKVKIQKYKWYSFIAEKTERWPWAKLQNAKQDSLHYLRLKKDSKLWIYVFFFYRCLSGFYSNASLHHFP